ncbi:lantibiotic dehydratase [Streptomyces bambusae]|uniref:Lantibiotic dehydratase N-terminal domain-containing protein n=1 Tax=Streptomyces bambusae TaxID=1550616 RepID=A0ABS6ZAM3_9ACTN|nr:lantibiotic dehydratase [Streptomyces bambusae]MBW5484278.1 hypothetical protein [Streptomyces bambusae]
MPYSAAPAAARAHPGSASAPYRVRSAPYALARATVLRHPAQSPPGAEFRTTLAELTELERAEAQLLPGLCDALHAARDDHPRAFHHGVVLPLRRALHNGRPPRPALLERLGDLPRRIPALAAWLALRERRALLLAGADRLTGPALVAERAALSLLCREPALGRAVAMISGDLLDAVARAAAGADDRRARKEEPAVLRYALRASTRTSPLSWFTAVGWGRLHEGPARPAGWGEAGLHAVPFTSVVHPNRALVGALAAALLADPARRAAAPHRMTSTPSTGNGRAVYSRARQVFTGGRHLSTGEDEVALPATAPLRLLDELGGRPHTLAELAGVLNAALRTPAGPGAVAAYLDGLAEAGLLTPADPVHPQDPAPLPALSHWLNPPGTGAARSGEAGSGEAGSATAGEAAGLAARIDRIDADTRAFGALPAQRRPAALAGLAARWGALLTEAGHPLPEPVGARTDVLSEDVVAVRPLDLGGFLDAADHTALAELTALAEAFDLGHVMRRLARARFVARYGPGGVCHNPWEFGPEAVEAWEEAGLLTAQASSQASAPPGSPPADRTLAELTVLRRTLAETVRAEARRAPEAPEAVLPAGLLAGLGDRLPRRLRERPASYAHFVQRAGDLLCVNHVYGGWGRFTSRFLGAMAPEAARTVSAEIRRGLGPGARAAAVRPVGGFNANLHPLLVPDEIGPDRRWTSLAEADVDLVHDLPSDQLRLRLRATGELLDVLYGGFLAPVMLPGRLAPYLCDHPEGVVDLHPLVPAHTLDVPGGRVVRTPRLRHRHLVLHRRRWYLDAGAVARLRAALEEGRPVPAAAVTRWRALLGLPDQVFLRPAPPSADPGRFAEAFVAGLRRPKPQFVDLGNALHLRSLHKWLARHADGAVLEEALPAPGGRDRPSQTVELVVETYREGSPE